MKKLPFNENWTCNGKSVTLPHDAQIGEKRSRDTSDGGHGYFPGGVYTYEKIFAVPDEFRRKTLILEFEGVYRHAVVSLNGREIARHAYGYTGFFVPLTDLTGTGENRLTVTADNSELPNSRWYTGSGIYRPVWLWVCEPEGLRPGSVKLSTVSLDPAVVHVESPIPVTAEIGGQSGEGTDFTVTIPDARLWSAEHPNLYTVTIRASDGDAVKIPFGIRKLEWSNRGFFVNGEETLLRGGCVHHDHGILGAATYAESEERRVRILKENGFNAVRSSHNPASTALIEACDWLGMYVMDETFDMWYNRKTRYDYGRDFAENWESDVTAMAERDFNHPSVVLYSIGNEVAEPAEAKGLETGQRMIDLLHVLDPTRPVTCGVNLMVLSRAAKGVGIYRDGEQKTAGGKQAEEKGEPKNASLAFNIMASLIGTGMNKGGNSKKVDALSSPFCDALDIVGYNYGSGRYPLDGKAHPDRVIFGSETFPQDIYKNWQAVKKYHYLVGDFMWTAWDYLGEAGLGAWSYTGGMPFNRPWPWLLAGAGVIDITGIPDASCKYAAVVWGLEKDPVIGVKPANHPGVRPSKSVWRGTNAILSWSWAGCEGNRTEVEVYSDQPTVELFLNGKSCGKKKTKENKAIFRLKYAPGTLEAVSYDASGKESGRRALKSAESGLRIGVHPEKAAAKPGEIVYVPVNIEDRNGTVESNADRRLTVAIENGELLGFGSSNPCTEERYTDGEFTTYYGRSLAVVRMGLSGKVAVTASDGKQTGKAEITVEE